MRPIIQLVTVCCVIALQQVPSSGAPAEPSSAQAALKSWGLAFLSAKTDAVMTHYEPSKETVVIVSTGDKTEGADAIRKAYDEAFEEVTFESVELDKLVVRESGDVAWARCRFRSITRAKGDGSRWKLDIRTSFVLKRTGGSWKIVLEHSSPISGVPRVQRITEESK